MTRSTTPALALTAILAVTACQDAGPTSPDAELTPPEVAQNLAFDDSPEYVENAKAFIGKFETGPIPGYPDGISYIYEVAVDQLDYRNGNSHKVWFIPESSKGLIVFAKDLATNQGITNSAPNPIRNGTRRCGFEGGGSDSFTDGDLPLECFWILGNGGNAVSGTFEMKLKRGRPGVKAVNNTGGDTPTVALDARTYTGSIEYDGTTYVLSVKADRVRFRNGSSHREFTIPESHKLDKGGFPGKVTCPFSRPGVEAFDGREDIECTWRVGNGPSRVTGDVTLS